MFNELVGTLPRNKCRWVICESCQGNGRVENPAFSNGFTSSEWNDMDYEERENYMAGVYDVPCHDCGMTGKQLVPDMSQLTFAEKRPFARVRMDAKLHEEMRRDSAMERRAEMRMGC